MHIAVHEDNTGFAPKHCRFTAIDDDSYDGAEDSRNRSTIGYGATPQEAITDLLEIMLDEGEITEAEHRVLCCVLWSEAGPVVVENEG